MWQSEVSILDILTILSVIMQIQSDEQSRQMQHQLDRIESKLDILLRKEG